MAQKEAVAAMERILGLDKPWHIQYIDWLVGVLHGDFGQSLRLSLPVADVCRRRILELRFFGDYSSIVRHYYCHPFGCLSLRLNAAVLQTS